MSRIFVMITSISPGFDRVTKIRDMCPAAVQHLRRHNAAAEGGDRLAR